MKFKKLFTISVNKSRLKFFFSLIVKLVWLTKRIVWVNKKYNKFSNTKTILFRSTAIDLFIRGSDDSWALIDKSCFLLFIDSLGFFVGEVIFSFYYFK